MSCKCPTTPCQCAPLNGTPEVRTTRCDRYVPGTANVWVERGASPNDASAVGVCMLDTMNDAQIIEILTRDDLAREDLTKVTSDPHLLDLAANAPKLPTVEEADRDQAFLNQPHNSGSIPLYALFRGNPPFAQ